VAKIKVVLWKSKKNAEGLCPIYIRIADTRTTKYISLREYVRENQWNLKRGEVRSSHQDADRINALIANKVAALRRQISDLKASNKPVTATLLKKGLVSGAHEANDFLGYARGVIAGYEKRNQIASYDRLSTIFNKLFDYHKKISGSEGLGFGDLSPEYLRRYSDFLAEHHDNSVNTVAKDLAGIRTIVFQAIREGVIDQRSNPFFGFKIKRAPVMKGRLTLEELERIEALDLEKESVLWHARNYFMFAVWVGGIRWGDLVWLRWEHVVSEDGRFRLRYSMAKTGQSVNMIISPDAEAILNLYMHRKGKSEFVFPILDNRKLETERNRLGAKATTNAVVNKSLQTIRVMADIDTHLSFHVARHSFAGLARKRGWDIAKISRALRHASLKQTQAYLDSLGDEELDADLDSLRG